MHFVSENCTSRVNHSSNAVNYLEQGLQI